MFGGSKRKHIIDKAIEKTIFQFAGRRPKIYNHSYLGAFDDAPHNLVITYLFETDAELASARASGYCNELEAATIQNLIALGYPPEAFVRTKVQIPKINFHIGSEEDHRKITEALSYRQAKIIISSKEDINRKSGGKYHKYFL